MARQGRDESSGTINVPKAKSARSRKVVLTEEGQQFLRDLAVGRPRSEIVIRRNDGVAFGAGQQKRRMGIACERAGIERITFHGLRHTYASQLAMAGVPLGLYSGCFGAPHAGDERPLYALRAVALCRNDPQCRALVQPHGVERYRD